jgi:hypothetical protein
MDGAEEIKLQSSNLHLVSKSGSDIPTFGFREIRSAFISGAIYREDFYRLVLGIQKGIGASRIAGE